MNHANIKIGVKFFIHFFKTVPVNFDYFHVFSGRIRIQETCHNANCADLDSHGTNFINIQAWGMTSYLYAPKDDCKASVDPLIN